VRNPFGGRMCRDVDPDKIFAFEPNDDSMYSVFNTKAAQMRISQGGCNAQG